MRQSSQSVYLTPKLSVFRSLQLFNMLARNCLFNSRLRSWPALWWTNLLWTYFCHNDSYTLWKRLPGFPDRTFSLKIDNYLDHVRLGLKLSHSTTVVCCPYSFCDIQQCHFCPHSFNENWNFHEIFFTPSNDIYKWLDQSQLISTYDRMTVKSWRFYEPFSLASWCVCLHRRIFLNQKIILRSVHKFYELLCSTTIMQHNFVTWGI